MNLESKERPSHLAPVLLSPRSRVISDVSSCHMLHFIFHAVSKKQNWQESLVDSAVYRPIDTYEVRHTLGTCDAAGGLTSMFVGNVFAASCSFCFVDFTSSWSLFRDGLEHRFVVMGVSRFLSPTRLIGTAQSQRNIIVSWILCETSQILKILTSGRSALSREWFFNQFLLVQRGGTLPAR